jgi:hypothetical protein
VLGLITVKTTRKNVSTASFIYFKTLQLHSKALELAKISSKPFVKAEGMERMALAQLCGFVINLQNGITATTGREGSLSISCWFVKQSDCLKHLYPPPLSNPH